MAIQVRGTCILICLILGLNQLGGQVLADRDLHASDYDDEVPTQKLGKKNVKKQTLGEVESRIIDEAPPAVLANGNGDIDPAGYCERAIERHCSDVDVGEGRLAECITERLQDEERGNTLGQRVSEKCRVELLEFKIDRSHNINKNVPLAKACKQDVKKICSQTNFDHPGAILACLRSSKPQLTPTCKQHVIEHQIEEAADFRLDPKLFKACAASAARLCPLEEYGQNVLRCLQNIKTRRKLDTDCKRELTRAEMERSDDARLDSGLMAKCLVSKRTFCADVPYGEGRVLRCLEDHRHKAQFEIECRMALEERIARESGDYRFNYSLREHCKSDINTFCQQEKEAIDAAPVASSDALVIRCLEVNLDQLKNRRCDAEVRRQIRREGEDIRFDSSLAAACESDRKKLCKSVAPGSARVITCLQESRSELDATCAEVLLSHEMRMAEDIDFNFPLRQACAVEMALLCPDVAHGQARILGCLRTNLEAEDMSLECKDEVNKEVRRAAIDWRLHFKLQRACAHDAQALCNQILQSDCTADKGCGGRVLNCLRDNMEAIKDETCREEVFQFVESEALDYRNDAVLAQACTNDVETHCQGVPPGEGRVHHCLQQHLEELDPACKEAEMKLQIAQARDVRLRPHLMEACAQEMSVVCKGVKPGQARMFQCLQSNIGHPDFSPACSKEISERSKQAQGNYRLDYALASQCKSDITALCSAETAQAHGHSLVLACLVTNEQHLGESCAKELSRAVRIALWDYTPGGPLTGGCDTDVSRLCANVTQHRGMFSIGAVGTCLAKKAAANKAMSAACMSLLQLAAPRTSAASEAALLGTLAERLAATAAATGYAGSLVNSNGSGLDSITLSGWTAIIALWSLCMLAVGGSVYFVRKLLGKDNSRARSGDYTLVVKQGDV